MKSTSPNHFFTRSAEQCFSLVYKTVFPDYSQIPVSPEEFQLGFDRTKRCPVDARGEKVCHQADVEKHFAQLPRHAHQQVVQDR